VLRCFKDYYRLKNFKHSNKTKMLSLKKKINSNGFGHIELLIFAVFIICISGIGYYVFKLVDSHKTDTHTSLAPFSSSSTVPKTTSSSSKSTSSPTTPTTTVKKTTSQTPNQAVPPSPTVSISGSPTSISYDSSTTISWSSTNATSCTASGSWSGSKALSGLVSTVDLTSSSHYTIDCIGAGGNISASVTINVTGINDASFIPLGVYAGINNSSGVASFASTTGTKVTMAETYLPWQANTGSSVGWAYLTTKSDLASWLSSWAGTNNQMVIGLPMVALDGSGNPENTLAEGAAGNEDATFVSIAQNLVALGFGNAVLRPGWEFDGTWYPWTVQSNADATNFATYWQNVVVAMRSVPGANFKFLWSPAGFQTLSWNIADAYPGNSYVDYVSEDVYDWSWDGSIFPSGDPNNTATAAQSNAVFNELLTDTEGLNWLAAFAKTNGKPIVIPEWAVTNRTDGHGLGDDPIFINNMASWFVSNHIAWDIYFVDNPTDNVNQGIDFLITDGDFPNSLATFKTDF
jgi:hypothetical protein